MSDFEFITEEEYQKIITDSLINGICVNTNVLKGLRKFLNDKCQRGYTNGPNIKINDVIYPDARDCTEGNTHEINAFLQEIKPEVVECDHTLDVPVSFMDANTYAEWSRQITHCPKCGERLKNE